MKYGPYEDKNGKLTEMPIVSESATISKKEKE